jgi:peptidoglycan/xylan/chitin deacetylase (PgdA/CDA1 family)
MRPLIRKTAIRLLDGAFDLGLYRFASRRYAGSGVIFSLHRVVDSSYPILHPGHLVTPAHLDGLIKVVRQLGWEIIGIDEACRRIATSNRGRNDNPPRRFACFTFDDGYASTLTHALPVFAKRSAPFCVYITSSFLDRTIDYWWGGLEELVLRSEKIKLPQWQGHPARTFVTKTFEEKQSAYFDLSAQCHRFGPPFLSVMREVFSAAEVNLESALERDALTKPQVLTLSLNQLVTIGSHTVSHPRLSQLSEANAAEEMLQGRQQLESLLNRPVTHFAYPFGREDACGQREYAIAKKLGFTSAVTTMPGNIFPEHGDHLLSLPRRSVPLNQVKVRGALFGVDALLQRTKRIQSV